MWTPYQLLHVTVATGKKLWWRGNDLGIGLAGQNFFLKRTGQDKKKDTYLFRSLSWDKIGSTGQWTQAHQQLDIKVLLWPSADLNTTGKQYWDAAHQWEFLKSNGLKQFYKEKWTIIFPEQWDRLKNPTEKFCSSGYCC